VINVLCQFSTSVQRASIDEAFLDLTEAVEKRMKDDTQVSIDNLQNSFVVGYESQNGMHILLYNSIKIVTYKICK
jgi:DNA polymerase eta